MRIRCLCPLWSPRGQMRKTSQEPSLCRSHTFYLSLQRLTICPYLLRDQLSFGILSEHKHTRTHTYTHRDCICPSMLCCVSRVVFLIRKSSVLTVCACLMTFTVLTCRGSFQSFLESFCVPVCFLCMQLKSEFVLFKFGMCCSLQCVGRVRVYVCEELLA